MPAFELIRRLRQMSFFEVRSRLEHKVRVSRERIALVRDGSHVQSVAWEYFWNPESVSSSALRNSLRRADGASEPMLVEYLFDRSRPSFYFRRDELPVMVRAFRQAFPGRCSRVIEQADRLRAHCLKIFAYPEIRCGPYIPWRTELIHGIESKLQHWSQIPFLDFSRVGDSKVVWEPNRHQHLVTLALAFQLTGDESYAEECLLQFEHWEQMNPYLRGINWASSLELAFRAWSWIWVIQLLAGSVALTGRRLGELTRALAQHAGSIAVNLSTFYSPNTHLLGEGFALFLVGLLFPELRHSEWHRETGRTILLQEITGQVREDGSHAEQSSCYHRYATEFFLYAAILADKNNCPFPASYLATVERMVDFMMHTAWPDGSQPMIGDADGGGLLAFADRNPNDHRGVLSTAAVYFARQDFRDRAKQFNEDTLWLLGPDARARFQQLAPNPPLKTSRRFPDAGTVLMRSGWEDESNMLLFDAGPQGQNGSGHGHADALSILCSAMGENWLIDPGTYVYTGSLRWRDWFRSTQAHNTVAIDGKSQAEPLGPFKWRHPCTAQLESWITTQSFDYASGRHIGYMRLAEPATHRRKVVFLKPDRWLLVDDVSGSGVHSLESFFHYPPDVQLRVEQNRCWAIKGESRFLLASDPCVSLATSLGEEGKGQGWYSADYGHRQAAHVLTGKVRCSVPAQFLWLLWPGAPDKVRLMRVSDEDSSWRLETDACVESIVLGNPRNEQTGQPIGTDADFVFLRQNRRGLIQRMLLIEGSWTNHARSPLWRSQHKVAWFEMTRQGASLDIFMRPEIPFTLTVRDVASVRLNGDVVEFRQAGEEITVGQGR